MPLKATDQEEPESIPDITYGALIGPNGQTSEILDRSEFVKLSTCLRMARFGTHEMEAIARAIYSCREPEKQTLPHFMRWLMVHLGNDDAEEVQGILTDCYDPPHYLSSYEVKHLAAYLKVLRARSWFSEWISLQVGNVADGNPIPSPLLVMQSLTDDLDQLELNLITARRMFKQHPELVAPEKAQSQPA